jgi:hypothetical protein
MKVDPVATYLAVFNHPANFVVDLNGAGTMAFQRGANGVRAWLFGAVWGRAAMRCPTARRVASRAAITALRVQRIESIVRAANVLARKACVDIGMRYQGRIPGELWYNGERVDGVWYEFDREIDFGLEPL